MTNALRASRALLACCVVLCATLGHAQTAPLSVEQILAEDSAGTMQNGQGVRAQLVPVNRTVLAAGTSARVAAVPFRQGQRVSKGDTVLEFDCASIRAQQKIYEAQRETARINVEVKQRLLQFNNVSPQELELANAELASAEAQLEVISLELAECRIVAPFDGIVVTRHVEPHQFASEGTPVLELFSTDELEVLLVAPSAWLRSLQPGNNFSLVVDELGQRFTGKVVRLGGRVDPVSQTVLVFGKLDESSPQLLPGMSGDIRFDRTP
ncbi:MAG: efflux RND transporter periplasmic adaptor subunit [Pseudomonadota bacterium]|nr:efflux RND transporter periplasmic adaptor subunit [Pseudomonadota bacterium]